MREKKQTFNVQRSTFNVEVGEETARIGEDSSAAAEQLAEAEKIFDLEDRLLEFTARLLKLIDALPNTRAGNHIAGQLLRCGTSPFANHGEAQAAESRKDFIHKLGICRKELKEIRRWLRLIGHIQLISPQRVRPLLVESDELIRIFSASIRTAQKATK